MGLFQRLRIRERLDRVFDSLNGGRLNWRLILALIVNLLLWIVILQAVGVLH